MKKMMIACCVSGALLLSPVQQAEASESAEGVTVSASYSFNDIPNNYRFAYNINRLGDYQLLDRAKVFRPEEAATRGEVADLIVRSVTRGSIVPQQETKFIDVPSTHRYSGMIQYAVDQGIISGFPDGSFRPEAPVTRGQMAILFKKGYEFFDDSLTRPHHLKPRARFKDMSPSMRSYEPVQSLVQFNVANGFADGTYRPNASITRGQLAYFIHQAHEKEMFTRAANDLIRRSGLKEKHGNALRYDSKKAYISEINHFALPLQVLKNGKLYPIGTYGYDWKKDRYYDEIQRGNDAPYGYGMPRSYYNF